MTTTALLASTPTTHTEAAATDEDIAARVSLSPGTVRSFLSAAQSKLGAATRHEAVSTARQRGWI